MNPIDDDAFCRQLLEFLISARIKSFSIIKNKHVCLQSIDVCTGVYRFLNVRIINPYCEGSHCIVPAFFRGRFLPEKLALDV